MSESKNLESFIDRCVRSIVIRWLWALDAENHKDCKSNCLTCEHFQECFDDSH